MTDTSHPLFLYGPGYSARALARLWTGPVLGTYRSDDGLKKLNQAGIEPVSILDERALTRVIDNAHMLVSIPPSDFGCQAFKTIGAAAARAASITYLSTTGVYGDLNGGWAMDWTPVNPQSARAKRRSLAEQEWRNAADRVSLVRLPGIYGPGRSAFERLRMGTARRIVKDRQVFSRVHVDDIARGLHAIISKSGRGVFNLCDDLAAPPQDVIAFASELAGIVTPPDICFADADLSAMARSFYTENKRVSNARLKAVTGWRPKYPTFREGLTAILEAGH